MAGANTTGQRAVSRVLVSRSSAQPVRGLGEQVGGGRGDHDQVGLLADPDVRDLVDVGPHLGGDRLAGERGPGRGADEVQRSGGGYDGHVVPRLGEAAGQLAGLVRRDPAGDPEDDTGPCPGLGHGLVVVVGGHATRRVTRPT